LLGSTRMTDQQLKLIVEDSVIGITEDNLSHMFNSFSQEEP
jgi:signal transduction histidine kinase